MSPRPKVTDDDFPCVWPSIRRGHRGEKPLPAATRRALDQMASGELNRHQDADDLFRKLGIELPKQ